MTARQRFKRMYDVVIRNFLFQDIFVSQSVIQQRYLNKTPAQAFTLT